MFLRQTVLLIGDFLNKTINSDDLLSPSSVDENESSYSFEINMLSYLPCQTTGYSIDTEEDTQNLRNELLECIDIYFETSSQVTFRYKYINGYYGSSSDNQEFFNQTSSNQDCIDSDGFRTIVIPVDNPGIIQIPSRIIMNQSALHEFLIVQIYLGSVQVQMQ